MKTFKKIILDDLRKAGKEAIIKKIVSIRYESYSGGSSVRVCTKNLFKTDREYLDAFLDRYEYGSFDGMTDSYNYDNRRLDVERQAKYVFLENEFSQDIRDKIIATLRDQWGIINDQTARDKRGEWYDTLIWRDATGLAEGE